MPWDIAVGADDNLWFTEHQAARIGRITTDGTVTEFTGVGGAGQLAGITAGPDGNLWYVSRHPGNLVGRITTDGTVTEFTDGITPGADPYAITGGPDGNLWFTELQADAIARITSGG
jgi:streptogramin lyase